MAIWDAPPTWWLLAIVVLAMLGGGLSLSTRGGRAGQVVDLPKPPRYGWSVPARRTRLGSGARRSINRRPMARIRRGSSRGRVRRYHLTADGSRSGARPRRAGTTVCDQLGRRSATRVPRHGRRPVRVVVELATRHHPRPRPGVDCRSSRGARANLESARRKRRLHVLSRRRDAAFGHHTGSGTDIVALGLPRGTFTR